MILRKAKLDDFEVFKKLYEDSKNLYQFLYNSSKTEDNTTSYNINLQQFQKMLENNTLLYMIEDLSGVVGYISLFYYAPNTYKIKEWAMFNSNDNDKKVEVLNRLKKLKLPRLRKFSICTIKDEVIMFLISNGFTNSCTTFYELEI